MKKLLISIGYAFAAVSAQASEVQTMYQVVNEGNPIVIVNGYKIRYADYYKIKPEHIESIIELEPEDAIAVFGHQGNNGAIVIKLISKFRAFAPEGAKIDAKIVEKVAYYAEQARLEAEAQAKKDAEEKARLEAEAQAQKEAAEQSRLEAEAQAKKAAEEQARLEAETQAKKAAEEKARLKAEAQAKKDAEEKARLEAEAQAQKAAEEQAKKKAEEQAKKAAEEKAEKEKALKALEEQKAAQQSMSSDFINKLEQDFKNSINNPKIKRVLIEGIEVTKSEALKLSVFDVETSIITFDKVNGDGTLQIKLSKK